MSEKRKVGRFEATPEEEDALDPIWHLSNAENMWVATVFLNGQRYVAECYDGPEDYLSAEDLRSIAAFIDELNGEERK
jgi:hypothetical protein